MADGLGSVSGVQVTVDDEDNEVRVDPGSGTIERDQPDGGVVVQFDAVRARDDGDGGFYENLAEKLGGMDLAKVANDLYEAIEADDRSRQQYLQIVTRAMDFLGLDMREPRVTAADSSAAVEGQSQVTNPLL